MPPATGGPVGYIPPEGGWGWAVVVGAFISIGFSYAFPKSITVFFKEIEQIFGATSSQVSWISSIMLAVMYAGGQSLSCFLYFSLSYRTFSFSCCVLSLCPLVFHYSEIKQPNTAVLVFKSLTCCPLLMCYWKHIFCVWV